MLDTNLLMYSAKAITTSGTGGTSGSTNPKAITVDKTPAAGVEIEVIVSAVAGSTAGGTLDLSIMGSDDDLTYVEVGAFSRITNASTGRYVARVQSKKKYLRLDSTVGTGTGFSATITAGIVSAGQRDLYA